MKIVKPRQDLLFTLGPILLFTFFVFAYWLRPQVLATLHCNWLVLVCAAILIITPWGNRKLIAESHEKPRNSPLLWLAQIAGLQLCLLGLYLGISSVAQHNINGITPNPTTLFGDTLHLLLSQYALLPWTLYTFMALAMGYCSYCRNENAYASTTLFPLFKSDVQQTFGLIINSLAKQATTIVFATTFAFISLMFAYSVIGTHFNLTTGFHSATMFTTITLLILFFLPPVKKRLHRALNGTILIALALMILCIIFAGIIVLLSLLFQGLTQNTVDLPNFIQKIIAKDWHTSWLLFSVAWWIGWTPLMGALFARISRGYSVRQIIAATLLLPAALTVFTFHPILPVFEVILGGAGFIGLLIAITQHDTLPMMMLSYLPARDQFKHRDHQAYFLRIMQLAAATLYLYLPGGIGLAYLLIFMLAMPAYILGMLAVIAFFKLIDT